MYNDKLDIKSPYIKKEGPDVGEIRRRIAKRATDYTGENKNRISLSNTSREESDNLLELRMQKVSKRIVGEEIRKFAEIASTEISGEFERLEKSLDKKIEALEETVHNNLLLQNENFVISEEDIEEKINSKLEELNSVLEQMENRIKDLEIYSIAENKCEDTEEVLEKPEETKKEALKEVEGKYSLNLLKETKKESTFEIKEVRNEKNEKGAEEEGKRVEKEYKKAVDEDVDDEEEDDDENDDTKKEYKERYKDEAEYDKKEKFVKEKVKKVADKFEKNGFLFKKNVFLSSLERLNVKDFLKEKKEVEGVDEKEKEKMLDILKDLIEDSHIEPKKDETIKHFLKRVYRKEYEKKD